MLRYFPNNWTLLLAVLVWTATSGATPLLRPVVPSGPIGIGEEFDVEVEVEGSRSTVRGGDGHGADGKATSEKSQSWSSYSQVFPGTLNTLASQCSYSQVFSRLPRTAMRPAFAQGQLAFSSQLVASVDSAPNPTST